MAATIKSKLVNFVVALLLLIPVIAGTVFASVTHLDISRAWSGPEEVTGAPVVATTGGAELKDARRAAGEAGAQAGFLVSGTGELTAGTQELVDAATPLGAGVGEAAAGAQRLHDGLVQLQAGTGQLGSGATEIADGVASAVEQLNGLVVVQQQLLLAIDNTDARLAENQAAEAKQLRDQLAGLRGQVEQFGLSVETTDRLNDLRSGTRDLANQLAVPGYGFHDGIYSATSGAAELAAGLGELEAGVDEAIDGFAALDEGANRIDAMATLNQEKTSAMQRALPVAPASTAVAETNDDEERSTVLAPMYALLIATLVMLGGAAIGWVTLKNKVVIPFVLLGITVLGAVLLQSLSSGMSVGTLAISTVVLALATSVGAILSRVLIKLFGPTTAVVLGVVGWIIQAAVVVHVWSIGTVADLTNTWQIIAGLMPLHYPAFALTSLGNSGTSTALWLAISVLFATGLIGLVLVKRTKATDSQNL